MVTNNYISQTFDKNNFHEGSFLYDL